MCRTRELLGAERPSSRARAAENRLRFIFLASKIAGMEKVGASGDHKGCSLAFIQLKREELQTDLV